MAIHYQQRKKAWLVTKSICIFVIYFVAFLMVAISYWIANHFGKPPLEQVLYHAQFGRSGLFDTDLTLVKSFAFYCLGIPFSLAFALSYYHQTLISTIHKRIHDRTYFKPLIAPKRFKALFFIKLFKPLNYLRLPGSVFLVCATYFCIQFSVTAYISQRFGPDYFSLNYLNPNDVNIRYVKPKNLIIIYVESLEKSYQDANVFGRNLLAKLDRIEGFSFDAFSQAPGTGWTIAGLTATQCGVPLKNVSLYDGNDQGEHIKAFLPNAVCLGDILNRAGYYNVFMGGASLSFSGKGKFFKDHHYDEVIGREELLASTTIEDTNYWGVYDDDLLIAVKKKITDLHAQQIPFNLSFVTVDTHGPDGHFSHYCANQGAVDFADIIECTADQIYELFLFIQSNGYLKDTNVVILGDHLAMYNPLNDALESLEQRFIYNKFISLDSHTKNREHLLHFDFFPTLLEFIGFDIEGGRLGLGFTGLKEVDTLMQVDQRDEMRHSLLNHSETYLNLWAR